jgi:hypothetical protein
MNTLIKERIVRIWADWELLHLGGNLYELFRLINFNWVRFTIFTADNDAKALERIQEVVTTSGNGGYC